MGPGPFSGLYNARKIRYDNNNYAQWAEVNGVKPDIDEALRYLGAGNGAPETLRREISAMADRLAGQLQPRWTYQVFDLRREDGAFRLCGPDIVLAGRTAERMLAQCGQAVLLACTLGVRFDALRRAEQVRDMARAVMLDALTDPQLADGAGRGTVQKKQSPHHVDRRRSSACRDIG